jgi:hypothetical protein
MAAHGGGARAPVPLLRCFVVTIHQCSCGYASVYKQKVTRHVARCGGSLSVLERAVPADGATPAGPSPSRPASSDEGRIARGSAEEKAAWEAMMRDDRVLNRVSTFSVDRACVMLYEEFQRRTRTARVRGVNVHEFQGKSAETVVSMAKYRVRAALDIAQRISMMKDSAAVADPRLQKIVATFLSPIDRDDPANELVGLEHLLLAKDRRVPLPPETSLETRGTLADMLKDIEAAACRASA